jgi:hypothetical protein
MKDIMKWTERQFKKLPARESFDTPIECDYLIILPTRRKHDSGWRAMDFVAVKDGIPICRCSGCSDVLNIDGTGGYGHSFPDKFVMARGWQIDCLPKSGLLRISCNYKITLGPALSNFDVIATEKSHYSEQKDMPW